MTARRKRAAGMGRGYDPERKRRQLVDAAIRVVGERGIAGATVPRIADAAGVSRGLLHYYFPTVAALLHAAARAHVAEWLDLLDEAIRREPSAPERARAVVGVARLLAAQQPHFWSFRAAVTAAAHTDPNLAAILADAAGAARARIGAVDALLVGFCTRPDARDLDRAAWDALQHAALTLTAHPPR